MLRKISIYIFINLLLLSSVHSIHAQNTPDDSLFINEVYKDLLVCGGGYNWLEHLCVNIGHRVSGSKGLDRATFYMEHLLDSLGFDSIWLQPCLVPHWVRGEKETGKVIKSGIGKFDIDLLALGNTNGTGPAGLIAPVIMFNDLNELKTTPKSLIEGKIVFINKHFEDQFQNTFEGYGATVPTRANGMMAALEKGALAFICRSVTTMADNHPHTGGTRIMDSLQQIPAFAVSINSADKLAIAVTAGKTVLRLISNAKYLGQTLGYNIIADIRGNENPEEILITAGHLDSWDVGQGAHDDGSGCVQSIEALHVLKRMGYRPKRTLRVILFTNEENGLSGGNRYKNYADSANEKIILAVESDAGGHIPLGFSYLNQPEKAKQFNRFIQLTNKEFKSRGLWIKSGHAGADIEPLKTHQALLLGLMPDSQRYFDYHHSANDTFDKVNKRELHLGTAAIATLIYYADKYGCN